MLRAGDASQFMARRRHSTLYPLELPQALPVTVYQQMVLRFRHYLSMELNNMVSQSKKVNFAENFKTHWSCLSTESNTPFASGRSLGDPRTELANALASALELEPGSGPNLGPTFRFP